MTELELKAKRESVHTVFSVRQPDISKYILRIFSEVLVIRRKQANMI